MKDDDDGRSGNGGPTERTRGGTERRMGTRHPGKPQRNRGNRRGTERDRGQSKRRGKSYKAMARARVKKMYAANQIQARVRGRVAKKRAEKRKHATVVVQKYTRGRLARKLLKRIKRAGLIIRMTRSMLNAGGKSFPTLMDERHMRRSASRAMSKPQSLPDLRRYSRRGNTPAAASMYLHALYRNERHVPQPEKTSPKCSSLTKASPATIQRGRTLSIPVPPPINPESLWQQRIHGSKYPSPTQRVKPAATRTRVAPSHVALWRRHPGEYESRSIKNWQGSRQAAPCPSRFDLRPPSQFQGVRLPVVDSPIKARPRPRRTGALIDDVRDACEQCQNRWQPCMHCYASLQAHRHRLTTISGTPY